MSDTKYAEGFREGLAWDLPGSTLVEFIDIETFALDSDAEREALREYRRGLHDGRRARAEALRKAGI